MLIDFIIQNSSPNKFAESNSINYVQTILSSNKDIDLVRFSINHITPIAKNIALEYSGM